MTRSCYCILDIISLISNKILNVALEKLLKASGFGRNVNKIEL